MKVYCYTSVNRMCLYLFYYIDSQIDSKHKRTPKNSFLEKFKFKPTEYWQNARIKARNIKSR